MKKTPRIPLLPFMLAMAAAAAAGAIAAGATAVGATAEGPTLQSQPPPQPPPAAPPPQRPQDPGIRLEISGPPGSPPRYGVAPFIALSNDAESVAAAKTITEVLWDDLDFEKEFYMIPRDVVASIPVPRSLAEIPFDRWQELDADAVVTGTVQKIGAQFRVEAHLYSVRAKQSAFAKEYTGSVANARLYAHTISDDIHKDRVALRGVARTKLAFTSDRDGERMGGTIEQRSVKELYISDYDGVNQRRATVNKSLNITPNWSSDARALAYTSYRRGYPEIFVSFIHLGTFETPAAGKGHNFVPAFSPDGTRIAFWSNRDGNPELYLMNRDGSGVRRLTNHPGTDVNPTWAPNGAQIAFVSDRGGTPQVYVVGSDGLNLRKLTSESYCDRPTWSPAPYNEIAYASRSGPGYEIKILDLAGGGVRQLTFGEGSNESPSYAPNGRHIAFTTTRWGKTQVALIARDGKGLKRITSTGNNQFPAWSP